MNDKPSQTPQPVRKKSRKVLIITLVCIFLLSPVIVTLTVLALSPSLKLCSDLARTGTKVSGLFESNLEVATYDYYCLGGTPPTTEYQNVTIGLLSDTTYESRDTFQAVITKDLVKGGWSVATTANESTVTDTPIMFNKESYTAKLTINSYKPAYARLTVKPTSPKANFGFAFKKAPNVPSTFNNEQALKYVTIPIYVPEYVPEGYSGWSVSARRIKETTATATLDGGRGEVSPFLNVSTIPAGYDITTGRELLTTTADGFLVYKPAADSLKNTSDLTAIVGDKLVTLENAYEHIYVDPQLTNEQISQILGSLKQTNAPAI